LICDAAKVEEILGVPPSRVVDVMALRGDSVDNIPGAPGIGDKGSVDLIRRFGSVEAALDRAAEVEKKTYRESLQNNRDNILYSKQLVTIDTDVAVEFDVSAMRVGEPDQQALRELFAELEFTTLLKELLPVTEVKDGDYREIKTRAEFDEYVGNVDAAPLAFAKATQARKRISLSPLSRDSWICGLRTQGLAKRKARALSRLRSASRFRMLRELVRWSRSKIGNLRSESRYCWRMRRRRNRSTT